MRSLTSIASILTSSAGIGGASHVIQPTTGRIDLPLTVAEEARPSSFSISFLFCSFKVSNSVLIFFFCFERLDSFPLVGFISF